MGNDGIAAVLHPGIIPTLIEHPQVAAKHAGKIHIPVDGTFVRADDHKAILIEAQLRHMAQKCLQNLIGGHYVIKTHQRHSVHQPRVVSVKGDDILNTHTLQLLQRDGAVQTLTDNTTVLPSAVQTGHNDRHAVSSAGNSLNQTLQVREMVIGGHMVLLTKQVVGQAVITGIHNEENVVTPNGLLDQAFGIAALETRAVAVNEKCFLLNANFPCPCTQVTINQIGQLLCTGTGNQSQMRDLRIRIEEFGRRDIVVRHGIISPPSQRYSKTTVLE